MNTKMLVWEKYNTMLVFDSGEILTQSKILSESSTAQIISPLIPP